MADPIRIILLEDLSDDAELVQIQLEQQGVDASVNWVANRETFLTTLDTSPDLFLLDFNLSAGFDGIAALKLIREHGLDSPCIFLSGTFGDDILAEALKLGADDFLLKDRLGRIGTSISHALESKRLRDENKKKENELRTSEVRYRGMFNSVPNSIWEEDFTELTKALEELRRDGVTDFKAYIDEHPGFLKQALAMVEILDVNETTLRLYKSKDKSNFIGRMDKFVTPENFRDEFLSFAAGDERFEREVLGSALDGSPLALWMTKAFYTDELGRLISLVTFNDISRRKKAENTIIQQVKRLNSLHTIDLAISSSFDLHTTLTVIVEQVLKILEIDACAILIFDNQSHMLEHAASRGFLSNATRQTKLRPGDGYAGHVSLERKTIHITDLMEKDNKLTSSLQYANENFVEYFGTPLIVKGEVKGVMEIYNRSRLNPDPDWVSFLETLGTQTAIAIDGAQLFESLQRSNFELTAAYDATIEGWSRALDLRDQETEGHTQRVTELSIKLAKLMNIPDTQIVHIRRGALLHDIGKMGIPDRILHKPEALDDEEWKIMRQHTLYANEMLKPIYHLRPALDIPTYHHEKWDGSGYPYQLSGEQIPLAARIFAVVDVWDALTSDRPYRPAWSREKALEYTREQSGKHFDPAIVDVFLELIYKK